MYYNIDKSLESLSENQWFRGASYQQYAITASNTLAAMLADNLENMQQSMMPGEGQGGGDFQLPDIIQSQEKLKEMMEGQEGSSGQQSGEQPSGSGAEGQEGGQEGNEGEEGDRGKEGQKGEGEEGSSGTEGGQGQGGQQGNGGEGDSEGEGGRDGNGNENGQGGSSRSAGDLGYEQIFEIYKEQQRIRLALEKQLEDMINNEDRELGKRIATEMEQFENELLRNGITERTAERINQIQQRLMQLKNASFQQEQESRRESKSNTEEFSNPILTRPERFERQDTNVEILNKQVLPLRLIYKQKVKSYFQNEENRLPL